LKRGQKGLIGFKPASARIIAARFRGTPLNIIIVQIYTPSADSTKAELERLTEELDDVLGIILKKDIKTEFVMGDWSVKVGQESS